jgi:apolipoprotein D and lipocalin family protein
MKAPTPVLRMPHAIAAAALATALAALVPTSPVAAQQRLLTVPEVDLKRYAGTWHEIARLPNRFQQQCVAEVSAVYTLLENGTVAVVNRCRTAETGDAAWDQAEGVARSVDPSNAKLKVSFLPPALRWLPIGWGDYWVLELDPDYRWVLVGEPSREYLWILSRTPMLPQDTLEGMLGRAREMGFPVDKVKLSPQKPPAPQ